MEQNKGQAWGPYPQSRTNKAHCKSTPQLKQGAQLKSSPKLRGNVPEEAAPTSLAPTCPQQQEPWAQLCHIRILMLRASRALLWGALIPPLSPAGIVSSKMGFGWLGGKAVMVWAGCVPLAAPLHLQGTRAGDLGLQGTSVCKGPGEAATRSALAHAMFSVTAAAIIPSRQEQPAWH